MALISVLFPDIQEYYELTIHGDSNCSADQTDGSVDLSAPGDVPAELSSQSEPPSAQESPQASGGAPPPKPFTQRSRSVKAPAPPIPSGANTPKTSSTLSTPTQSQPAKVKYRAPLPPVHPGASKPPLSGTPKPSSPYGATPSGFTVNGAETPTGAAVNGTKPQLTATSSLSSENSTTSANPQSSSVSPDHNLVTVSALVSSTIQGFVSPESLSPISPGFNRVADDERISTAPVINRGPCTSPSTDNYIQDNFTFGIRSPTGPSEPFPKGPHLRYVQ